MEDSFSLGEIIAATIFLFVNAGIWFLSEYQQRFTKNYLKRIDERLDQEKSLLHENQMVLETIMRERKAIQEEVLSRYQRQKMEDEETMTYIMTHKEHIDSMSYEDFADWMDQAELYYIEKAIPFFKSAGLKKKAAMMEGYLKNKLSTGNKAEQPE